MPYIPTVSPTCEQFSFALTIRMRWSKNVTEERDAPTQIVLASMNSLHCVHLSLAVYLEIFLSRGEDRGSIYLFNCLECDGPVELNRSARKFFENDIFSSPQFVKTKPGNLGSHSVKKRATTRARASGCKKDHVDYRARWKNLKRQQDRYTENELVYPDAEVAGVLCHGGPCEYAIKEGVNISKEWIVEHVTPNISRVFGNGVAFILGKALLWAIFANSEECVITIPQEMKQRVQAAYRRIMVRSQNESNQIMQPIQKYLLAISNMEEAVMITRARNQRTLSAPIGVIGEYDTHVDGISTRLTHNRLDDMERTIIELKNANDHNFQAMDARLERMERSIKRLMMTPFRMQVQPSIPETNTGANEGRTNTVANRNPSEARPSFESSLVANPRDLFVLWQEYEFGVGGRKAAKLFTSSERGKVKFKYSRRKIVWECIHRLIRSGYTADSAIDKIYDVYGRSTSVSTIINRMRDDEKRGGQPELS